MFFNLRSFMLCGLTLLVYYVTVILISVLRCFLLLFLLELEGSS